MSGMLWIKGLSERVGRHLVCGLRSATRLRTHEPSPSAKMIRHLEDDSGILSRTFLFQLVVFVFDGLLTACAPSCAALLQLAALRAAASDLLSSIKTRITSTTTRPPRSPPVQIFSAAPPADAAQPLQSRSAAAATMSEAQPPP